MSYGVSCGLLCKECNSSRRKKLYIANMGVERERCKKISARRRRDPAVLIKTRAAARAWQKYNKPKATALVNAYRVAKINRMPQWLTQSQKRQILGYYIQAAELSRLTGELHSVDHIVPLRGKLVSGLHVPWNLQVLPASLNSSKGNKVPV